MYCISRVFSFGSLGSLNKEYWFDFSFVNNLSLEDGLATLTEFTAKIIIYAIKAGNRYKEKNGKS